MTSPSKKNISWQFYLLQLPFWSALILLVTFTLLVVLIRFLVPQIDTLRPQLENWLTARLPFEVEITHLSGSLFKIDPAIGIDKLTLTSNDQKFLVIEDVYFELDTFASLMALAPRMKDARLSGLELWMEENQQGWQLNGWQKNTSTDVPAKKNSLEASFKQMVNYAEQLLVQGELVFSDLKFHFLPLDEDPLYFTAESMNYRRWSKGRQLSFQIESSATTTQTAELVVTLEGENFDHQTSNLDAWFNFPLVSLEAFKGLWPSHVQERTQNMEGHFSVEGWFNLKQGQVQLDLQARNVELVRDDFWKVEFETADITLKGKLATWSADWEVTNLNASDYFFDKLAGRVGQNQHSSYLQVEELLLTPLSQYLQEDLHLPDAVRELVSDLAPGGSLKNLLITENSIGELELQANLVDLQVNAWEGAPLGGGLNGWLQANTEGGQVVFANHPLQLGFPELYTPIWNFSSAKGAVRWELEGEDLWVIGEDLAVVLPLDDIPANNVYVSGDFAYFYGSSDERFYLNLGLLPTKAIAHHQLVPDKLVEPVLLEWLNSALLAGKVHQAGFIYAGSIQDNAAFQLVTDFSATNFKFQPDWPSLSGASGQVQVLDGWVKGEVSATEFGSSQLNKATFATFLNTKNEVELEIATQLQAPLEFFPWLVKNSPLKTQVPEPLHEWQYSGQMQGDISLVVPLSEADLEPFVNLKSHITQGQLTLSQVDLTVTDINGPLNFTLAKGLESKGLTGRVLDQPVKAIFENERESHLKFSASVSGEGLKKRFHLQKSLNLKGITQIQGSLPLAPFGVLKVTSDLQGLAYNTPLPWRKKTNEKRQFTIQLDFSDEELPLRLQLADQLDFLMHLDNQARGSRLQLAEKAVSKAVLPEELGLFVNIMLNQLNAEPIYAWYKKLNSNQTAQLGSSDLTELQGLSRLELNIAKLNWKELEVGELDFTLQNLNKGLKFNFASSISSGEVWWPANDKQQLEIMLGHLYLPVDEKDKSETKKAPFKRSNRPKTVDLLADFNPQLLPAAVVKIADIRLGSRRFGKLETQVSPKAKGVRLDPLQVNLEESSLEARLDWLVSDSVPSSYLEGKLSGKNIELALKAVTAEIEAPVVSDEHELNFTANWPGSPLAFDLKEADAELQLELKDGYFPKTDLALSGISQVFGLLNMDTLLRRLRLDFSDLTSKGVSYNSIKGDYQLENGYLRTTQPTRVASSSTRMKLTGEVDLIEETLQQELVIVLPVAQSLPLAAVLVGAPQVGAAIWVIQKIFSNLFDTFTEARYKVTGPLNDPKVELQRVF